MVRKVVVRAVVAGAAVLVSVLGAVVGGTGDPGRHGSPPGACGGSADVRCLASKVAWNGTGLVIVNPRGV